MILPQINYAEDHTSTSRNIAYHSPFSERRLQGNKLKCPVNSTTDCFISEREIATRCTSCMDLTERLICSTCIPQAEINLKSQKYKLLHQFECTSSPAVANNGSEKRKDKNEIDYEQNSFIHQIEKHSNANIFPQHNDYDLKAVQTNREDMHTASNCVLKTTNSKIVHRNKPTIFDKDFESKHFKHNKYKLPGHLDCKCDSTVTTNNKSGKYIFGERHFVLNSSFQKLDFPKHLDNLRDSKSVAINRNGKYKTDEVPTVMKFGISDLNSKMKSVDHKKCEVDDRIDCECGSVIMTNNCAKYEIGDRQTKAGISDSDSGIASPLSPTSIYGVTSNFKLDGHEECCFGDLLASSKLQMQEKVSKYLINLMY